MSTIREDRPGSFGTLLRVLSLLVLLYALVRNGEATPVEYLVRYGYIPFYPGSDDAVPHDELVRAVRDYQAFVGLNTTGKLDNDTIHKMTLPRCGVKDKDPETNNTSNKRKRYVVHGSRWSKKYLTYKISKYSERLTRKEVDEVVWKAFKTWSEVTPLTFSQRPFGPVDIDIRFELGEHGDGKNSSFDGPGGNLAHAFFPVFGGSAHFDDAEDWSLSDEGLNLYSVAAHEFGHSLGLHHTDVHEAVMAPYYKYNDFGLHSDDIEGIQSLYGERHQQYGGFVPFMPHYKPHLPEIVDLPDLCEDPKIDAMFSTPLGKTFLFKGDYYWEVDEGKLVDSRPRRINETWYGLPGDIDAAFTYNDGRTYFFKGSQYWGFRGRLKDIGYPKNISENLPGIPDNVDAAMVWAGNGKLYFFKGSEFWRYEPEKNTHPKPIKYWTGVPENLDAAFTHPGGWTYFIKGNSFYKFNNWHFEVEKSDPPYPRTLTDYVFDCHDHQD